VADGDVQEGAGAVPESIEEAHQLIALLQDELRKVQRENQSLQHRVDLLCRRLFGRQSEKGLTVPEQGLLPFATAAGVVTPEASDEQSAADAESSEKTPPARRRKHPGRRTLPSDLPRERVEVTPAPSDLLCQHCDAPKMRIGEDRTETLDYVPAAFMIREYVRGKYACKVCQDGVTQAALPARPIEKGRPEPGLLAHVVTSKYADHLPLYRLEAIFARHGIEVSRRTLAEWNGATADLLMPVVAVALKAQVLESPWIQFDDTTLDVQVDDREPKIRTGHMWVYRGAFGEVVYDFTWARSREGPMRMLEGFRGYAQADAAPAHDELFRQYPEIVEVACWAHARRYFKEAVGSAPVPAGRVVLLVGELYGVERAAAELSSEARQRMREEKSRPILKRIFEYLDEIQLGALPKSPLGEAIGYARRNRDALTRYLEDGRLKIDNNGAERAIKPLVIGRKNWLFCGSEAAAHRTAILLSLVQTCKHLGVDPFVYLRDVIDRVSTHPMSRILDLTPREWKRLRQQSTEQAAA
jgi:transposase